MIIISEADQAATTNSMSSGEQTNQIPTGVLLFDMEAGINFTGNAQLSSDSMVSNTEPNYTINLHAADVNVKSKLMPFSL